MADSLELKEVELDYEADDADEQVETPTPRDDTPTLPTETEATIEAEEDKNDKVENDDNDEEGTEDATNNEKTEESEPRPDVSTDIINSPAQDDDDDGELEDDEEEEGEEKKEDNGDGELESGEELEDGEISDEDEALKNERLEPKPVCRFFSKGQCTWGSSCRFLHPGVLDKGNYSMFAAPRPILPGESSEDAEVARKPEEPVPRVPSQAPEPESAWERGMRQAKEMRRRSSKRREMDVEYEEKKTSQSLTQVELDKENDYYMRPASPAHTHDPYAAEEEYYNERDPYDTYHPEVRRVAPPPPPDFIAREERERSRYHEPYPPPGHGPPRPRRVAPPRSPSPTHRGRVAPPPPAHFNHGPPGAGPPPGNRFRGGEDWADPWMRSGPDRGKGGGGGHRPREDRFGRKRSYSSGSSRSSSGSSRSRSPRRRRRYSSSYSSRSSSRSRSRSSTPAGIPRRNDTNNTAKAKVKREPGGHASGRNTAPLQKRLAGISQNKHRDDKHRKSRGDSSDDERGRNKSGQDKHKSDKLKDKNREPFKMNMPKNQIKLTLKGSGSSKPSGSNNEVFEKPGEAEESKKSLKRKAEDSDAVRQQQKLASMKSKIDAISKSAEKIKSEKLADGDAKKSKAAKVAAANAAAAGAAGNAANAADTKNRREELLKQLKAVEEAIHRKRSKLDK